MLNLFQSFAKEKYRITPWVVKAFPSEKNGIIVKKGMEKTPSGMVFWEFSKNEKV